MPVIAEASPPARTGTGVATGATMANLTAKVVLILTVMVAHVAMADRNRWLFFTSPLASSQWHAARPSG